jgi:small GTP-binding protein
VVEKVLSDLSDYAEEHKAILKGNPTIVGILRQIGTGSFETLTEKNPKAANTITELAKIVKPIRLEGNQIALFGITSTGKSTMLNSLLGENVAETGYGETTMKMTPYPCINFVIWDVPGRNDEVSYMTMQYISFLKGLTQRLILIKNTVKENSSIMKLMDTMQLRYAIAFNQFDMVPDTEKSKVREQVHKQIGELGLKGVDHVFFVSAQYPSRYDDWLEMVKYLAIMN